MEPPPLKKSKQSELNSNFTEKFLAKLSEKWVNSSDFEEGNVKINKFPFLHCEINNFIDDEETVDKILEQFNKPAKISFEEKSSDLFQFKQSQDLMKILHLGFLKELFEEKVYPVVNEITKLPLNKIIDMFFSIYEQNDFLLCHDDELDSRRIAFIYYLSDFELEWGGTLDLYDCDEKFFPKEIVKKIEPKKNKFVFFEVSSKSFHQVSEILKSDEKKKRLALSGWFYGDPLPRPKIDIPEENYIEFQEFLGNDFQMKSTINNSYLSKKNISEINAKLVEDSHTLLTNFLLQPIYEEMKEKLSSLQWRHIGPYNLKSIFIPSSNQNQNSSDSDLDNFTSFFKSPNFAAFISKVTEFKISDSLVKFSIKKFVHKSYELLLSRYEPDEEEECENGDEEEEETDIIDVVFYFGDLKEGAGGTTNYIDSTGAHLVTIPAVQNCLGIIVRDKTVNPCVSYINSSAADSSFIALNLTFKINDSSAFDSDSEELNSRIGDLDSDKSDNE